MSRPARHQPDSDAPERQIEAALRCLSDPVRRQIVDRLAGEELAAGEIVSLVQRELAITQSAVSQHLTVLRQAGLVRVRAVGARRLYALESSGLDELRDWLEAITGTAGRGAETRPTDPEPGTPFDQPLDALATELARGRRERRAPGRPSRTRGKSANGDAAAG